jgi:hypothetical protein
MRPETDARELAVTQGVYYVATGIWPLLDIESFERITGPKADRWLVKTVGALVTADALAQAALLVAWVRWRGRAKNHA